MSHVKTFIWSKLWGSKSRSPTTHGRRSERHAIDDRRLVFDADSGGGIAIDARCDRPNTRGPDTRGPDIWGPNFWGPGQARGDGRRTAAEPVGDDSPIAETRIGHFGSRVAA